MYNIIKLKKSPWECVVINNVYLEGDNQSYVHVLYQSIFLLQCYFLYKLNIGKDTRENRFVYFLVLLSLSLSYFRINT